MKRLFGRLRENYDYVIVDLSPVVPVVDVRSTTHLLDSYVFVVEWGKTKIDVAEHALNSARGVYDNLLGVVLNKVDFKAAQSLRRPWQLLLQSPLRPLRLHGLMTPNVALPPYLVLPKASSGFFCRP